MISAVCFGTNDLTRAGEFYDRVLGILGMERLSANDVEIGYGAAGAEPVFWILIPFNRETATYGNGTQIIFNTPDQETVERFYHTVIELGGSDEGAPDLRDYTPGYYGAYCRDLDGNKLHAYVVLN